MSTLTHEDLELIASSILRPRDPEYHNVKVSDTRPWIVNYYNRKHVYLYSNSAITMTVEDFGHFPLAADTLQLFPFDQGIRVYSTTAATAYAFLLIATDELLPVGGGGGGGGIFEGYTPGTGAAYAQLDTQTTDGLGVAYGKLIVKSIAIDGSGNITATIGESSNPGYQVITSGPTGPNLALGSVGEMNTSPGGNVTASVSTSTNIITRAGRLCQAMVTTANTTTTTFYDSNNSTTTNKTIVGIIPANPTVGAIYTFGFPVSNGIYVVTGTNGVATVGYD